LTEKGKDLQNAQDLYNEILSSKEKIKRTAPRRKKRETLLWKEFEINYRKDLEVTSYITIMQHRGKFLWGPWPIFTDINYVTDPRKLIGMIIQFIICISKN
jgi:hypothetical protein